MKMGNISAIGMGNNNQDEGSSITDNQANHVKTEDDENGENRSKKSRTQSPDSSSGNPNYRPMVGDGSAAAYEAERTDHCAKLSNQSQKQNKVQKSNSQNAASKDRYSSLEGCFLALE